MTNSTDVPMKEFLLWSNCANHCKFCWQRKLAKPEMLLSESEKLDSIAAVRNEIEGLGVTDILIVGGEVYNTHSKEVDDALIDLFRYIADRVRTGKTRLLYANTNMIYADTKVLDGLIDAFDGMEDKLRLTTSYDIYGRYSNENDRRIFLHTLHKTTQDHPRVQVIVNCILTRQACEEILSGKFNINDFVNHYRVLTVNFIPYIPVDAHDEMVPSWSMIAQTLSYIDEVCPNYLVYYIRQMDWIQPRVLKEYHKNEGYVECTSKYLDCGHNENYKRPTGDGTCYVCRLKELLQKDEVMTEEDLARYIQDGYKIITVGDMISSHVWTTYRQPDIVIFDGKDKPEDFEDVLPMVRDSNTKRIIVNNPGGMLTPETEISIHTLIREFNGTPVAVQTLDEEDEVVFSCTMAIPEGWIVAYGDNKNHCMRCFKHA